MLINESMQSSSPIVFVRRDLIPSREASADTDVRVRDVTARVRLEQDGGLEISVQATVASRRSDEPAAFTVPVETATLTECTLNDQPVAPVRGQDGGPQMRLPPAAETTPQNDSTESDADNWQQHQIRYTLRSNVRTASGRIAIRVPLPWSARTRLTLESTSDPILSARLSNGRTGSVDSDGVTFPLQFNQGPLDLQLVTQRSRSEISDRSWITDVTCRVRVMEDRTLLKCGYRIMSDEPAPTELLLPVMPGYQVGEVRAADNASLETAMVGDDLAVRGTREQLRNFSVTWVPAAENMDVIRTIPAAALTPPARCRSGRTLLAVDVSEPFDIGSAVQAGNPLNPTILSRNELTDLGLSPTDHCFDVASLSDNIDVRLDLLATQRTASITQTLVVGVDSLNWACECDMDITGPPVFRQQIRVPRDLLIDEVNVSGNRVRSWSVRDALLLVSFREGTRGSFQLSIRGILKIPPDGRIDVLPATLEQTDVMESIFLVSSTSDAAVQVDDASGTDGANPITDDVFSLNLHPVRLTIDDPQVPLKLSARHLQQTTGRLLLLTWHDRPTPVADLAIRIQAGDQRWDGRIRLPDELTDAAVEWITDDASMTLPIEGGELPARRLTPGRAAVLLLRGIRMPTDGSTRRLPLPVLEPNVSIERVQLFGRLHETARSEQLGVSWILTTLQDPNLSAPPPGVIDRGRSEHYDAHDNSIHVTGLQTDSSAPISVIQQAARSVAVHQVASTDSGFSGSTDLLIDFGEASEACCVIPPQMKVVSCRLDGVELPQQTDPQAITIRRSSRIQRLRIHWLTSQNGPGYLPRQRRVDVPAVDTLQQDQYLFFSSPDSHSWTASQSLVAITPAQLETRLSAALVESTAETNSDSADRNTRDTQTMADFLSDQQSAAAQQDHLFEMSNSRSAGVLWRRRLQWMQWFPIMILAAAGLTVTGHRISLNRQTQSASQIITSDLSDHAEPDSQASSDSTPSTPI